MRAALECCHKGWGESTIIGVAGAGRDFDAPFQLVTGRSGAARLLVACAGAPSCRAMWPVAQRGEIPLDTFITHTMGADEINTAFELMHEGHSHRDPLLSGRPMSLECPPASAASAAGNKRYRHRAASPAATLFAVIAAAGRIGQRLPVYWLGPDLHR